MANFRIPPAYKKGFKILLTQPTKELNKIMTSFDEAGIGLLPEELSSKIAENSSLTDKEATEVVRVVFSLYELFERHKEKFEDTIDGIIDAIKDWDDGDIDSDKVDLEEFKLVLRDLLTKSNLRLTFKTVDLTTEYEKTFVESRILTDIRPAFDTDLGENIKTAVIVHNLRIEFHQDKGHDKIIIAMDSDDLKNLKEEIDRAEKKENSIKNYLGQQIQFINPTVK